MNARLGTGCSIMIEGRRARSVRGSPHGDRPIRRGASVTGVCQCASRAFSLWCRASTACTDGSSPGHWLGRSSYPGLGSRRNNHAVRDSCSTSARVRGPPRVRVHRRRFKNGLTNKSSWKRTPAKDRLPVANRDVGSGMSAQLSLQPRQRFCLIDLQTVRPSFNDSEASRATKTPDPGRAFDLARRPGDLMVHQHLHEVVLGGSAQHPDRRAGLRHRDSRPAEMADRRIRWHPVIRKVIEQRVSR